MKYPYTLGLAAEAKHLETTVMKILTKSTDGVTVACNRLELMETL